MAASFEDGRAQRKSRMAREMPHLSKSCIDKIHRMLNDASDNGPCATSNCKSSTFDLKHETPYGRLCQSIDLPLRDGGTLKWLVASPLALLFTPCQVSSKIAKFLQSVADYSSGFASLTLIYYTDEETPGNVLLPDHST